MKEIDEKHYIEGERIFKKNGQPIPDNEPVILFRGRDKLALPLLLHYRSMCVKGGCTDFQLQSVDRMIQKFQKFANESSTMKQPGCTLGE